MEDAEKSVVLRVAKARLSDLDRGVACVDPAVAEEMGWQSQDILLIENLEETVGNADQIDLHARTAARVEIADPEDWGANNVHIDGTSRRNARVGLGERVLVRRVVAQPAESVTIDPFRYRFSGIEERQFINNFITQPVMLGNIVSYVILGSRFEALVVDVQPPAEVVIVTTETAVTVLTRTLDNQTEGAESDFIAEKVNPDLVPILTQKLDKLILGPRFIIAEINKIRVNMEEFRDIIQKTNFQSIVDAVGEMKTFIQEVVGLIGELTNGINELRNNIAKINPPGETNPEGAGDNGEED